MPLPAAKSLALYERGAITGDTLPAALVECAADQPPTELAGGIPAEVLTELRAVVATPVAEDRLVIVESLCNGPGFDPVAYAAGLVERKRRYVRGSDNWRAYFADRSVAPPGLEGEGRGDQGLAPLATGCRRSAAQGDAPAADIARTPAERR
jgi:hypothetical protein